MNRYDSFEKFKQFMRSTVREHEDIFACDVSYSPSIDLGYFRRDPDGDEYREVSWPNGATRDDTKGLELKGNKGIVTLLFKLKKTRSGVEEVGHSFRYIDSNHKIRMEHYFEGETATWGPKAFSFRYDRDFTPNNNDDPPVHLQLAHNAPRFIMGDVTLADFLNTVRQTCFNQGTLDPNNTPLFNNRR